jgi:arylsulfatase A-like enzyme
MRRDAPVVLLVIWLVLACGCGGERREAPVDPPSIVFVMIDTLRADHLQHHGYPRETSPNISRWAGKGTCFTRAVAASPWTGPSVASMVTGYYPDELGIRDLDDPLPRAASTLAEILSEHGYETGAVISNGYIAAWFGHDQGYGYFHQEQYTGEDDNFTPVSTADRITDLALEWLRGAPRPFFLYVHYTDPHDPYLPPEEWSERFLEEAGSLDPELLLQGNFTRVPLTRSQLVAVHAMYEASIAFTDHEVNRLLERVSPDELLVIVGDHGEEFQEHGGFRHGHTVFEELLHVPLIFAGAGVEAGRVVDEVVSHVDILPTVLELSGYAAPRGVSGRSLLPLLDRSRDALEPRVVFGVREFRGSRVVAARDGRWKLIYQREPERLALFDLEADPREQRDLRRHEPRVVKELMAAIVKRRSRVAAAPELDDEELERKRLQELRSLGYID